MRNAQIITEVISANVTMASLAMAPIVVIRMSAHRNRPMIVTWTRLSASTNQEISRVFASTGLSEMAATALI